MDLKDNIIIINGVDKTAQIDSIKRDGYKYAIKFKNTNKVYSYSADKIVWVGNPVSIKFEGCNIFVNGRKEGNIEFINLFSANSMKYYCIGYQSGFIHHYTDSEVDIRRSCLSEKAAGVLDYLRQCAGINSLGINEEENILEGILSSIYSNIDFVDEQTAAAVYLNPNLGIKHTKIETPLLPFGCNASQVRAVKEALSNQISVIQGPPGTGKTQTILNIVANLLKADKTVLIVSNNNSATENIFGKLNKNGLGFLVAPLGNKENKEAFIANQPPLNPELPSWNKTMKEINRSYAEVKTNLEQVEMVFEEQERLAVYQQELAEVKVEMSHFSQENIKDLTDKEVKTSSARILKIIGQLKRYINEYQKYTDGLLNRMRQTFDKLYLKLCLRFFLSIKDELTLESIPRLITQLYQSFYISRIQELESEIANIKAHLLRCDANALLKSLTGNSMVILKATIAQRYKTERAKIISTKELFNNGDSVLSDYPIVLSTTFSSKTCFNNDTLFDYVIMDEASQVSVETGLLALTCAKNAVIVGDTMQLPNVVTEDDRVKLNEIRKSADVPESYDAVSHSFLSSILATIPNVPETLLREHYRCHPDIINFCNQKFYGGSLLIMTKRDDGEKHLLALMTAPGQHCRGHYNQREIDAVKIELMPLLDNKEDTGIIAPYNSQVNQFRAQIPHIEAATVHKYQGREKDTIIMSVTDDAITEFADDSNLLNVAVSRAKNKFCLVVTSNPQELKGNIHDLLGYIRYQQGTIMQSKLRSIFDYLFSQISEYDRGTRSISDYKSENLTFDLIERIRKQYPQLSHIKALHNYPMRYLIRDTSDLSDRETRYALNPATHIDFLIINCVTKEPLLAIETDGYNFHNQQTKQFYRDRIKDKILDIYGLPLLRLSTVGYGEEQRIVEALKDNIRVTSLAK